MRLAEKRIFVGSAVAPVRATLTPRYARPWLGEFVLAVTSTAAPTPAFCVRFRH